MYVDWNKCKNNLWCGLYSLDLTSVHFNNLRGVYVIWYWDKLGNPIAIRVGQGEIRERILYHRTNPQITAYRTIQQFPPRPIPEFRPLYVTWAEVRIQDKRLGVERYLANMLKPLVGEYPDVLPIQVNLPPWY